MDPNASANEVSGNGGTSEFERYLRAEYAHIAEAHFRTIDTISAFFRYYLLIVSIPVSLIVLVLTIAPNPEDLKDLLSTLQPVLGAVFIAISLVAFFLLLYVVNLRMDAILYARTVNAIRKHFFDGANLDLNVKLRLRVLPQTPFQPAYAEHVYFLPVVFCFGIFNTLYLVVALTLLTALTKTDSEPIRLALEEVPWWGWLVAVVYFLGHFVAYSLYANYRENAYLRSYAVGVDIDGVLNLHREHFCTLLHEHTGKTVDPREIMTIPVHECETLDVTSDDAKRVFNDPRYWTDMPPVHDAAENLRKLRNAFKMRIMVFSHRAWPNTAGMNASERRQLVESWKEQARRSLKDGQAGISQKLRRLVRLTLVNMGGSPMRQITRSWLERHSLEYHELIIEKGNEDVSDPRGHVRNRFYMSRKRKIRFFVEDDADKASKLAYICDVVLLLKQPYNETAGPLPDNVIRVDSWDQIYKELRRLS